MVANRNILMILMAVWLSVRPVLTDSMEDDESLLTSGGFDEIAGEEEADVISILPAFNSSKVSVFGQKIVNATARNSSDAGAVNVTKSGAKSRREAFIEIIEFRPFNSSDIDEVNSDSNSTESDLEDESDSANETLGDRSKRDLPSWSNLTSNASDFFGTLFNFTTIRNATSNATHWLHTVQKKLGNINATDVMHSLRSPSNWTLANLTAAAAEIFDGSDPASSTDDEADIPTNNTTVADDALNSPEWNVLRKRRQEPEDLSGRSIFPPFGPFNLFGSAVTTSTTPAPQVVIAPGPYNPPAYKPASYGVPAADLYGTPVAYSSPVYGPVPYNVPEASAPYPPPAYTTPCPYKSAAAFNNP